MKTLIIGGTGTVGKEVVNALLKRNQQIRVLTTSEEKAKKLPSAAEAFIGNLDDISSLEKAFQGIQKVFLLNVQNHNEVQQGLNAIEVAIKTGVEKMVYQSIHNVRKAAHIPHFQPKIRIEEAIIASGLNYTFVAPNNFYQNDLFLNEAIANYNLYTQPIGAIGLSRVDVRDIAQVVATVLLSDAYSKESIPLAGPDILTGKKTAQILSEKLGYRVNYAGDNLENWAAQAKNWMPEWLVEDLKVMYQFFQEQGLIASQSDLNKLRKVLGREPIRYAAHFQPS